MNVAANNLRLTDAISRDGATVSQAITYCDQIIDNPSGDDSEAIEILDKINSGQKVNAGVIPLSTQQIAYRSRMALRTFRVTSDAGRGVQAFRFSMGRAGRVRLSVFDVSGRLVTTLVDGDVSAGEQSVLWNGGRDTSHRSAKGIYFARLETEAGVRSLKVVQLSR